MTNIIKSTLQNIFGDSLPEKTTNFHTVGRKAVFVTTDHARTPVTEYVEVEMMDEQKAALKNKNLLGSFGWALQ